MSQPIDVGTILGGRYKVTELVLTSADGDAVLGGMDQVLNRSVSILVAAPENASQVATSAREIATGERYGSMQVLDLGISDGSTYLITNTASPADLLDLVIQRDAPFVEPFYTDTLGSEIFGVTRSAEPEVYEDEDEYWEELEANEERNVGGRVAKRLTGLTNRFGRGKKDDDAAVAGAAGAGSAVAAAGAASAASSQDAGEPDGQAANPATAAAPGIPERPQVPPKTPTTTAHPVTRADSEEARGTEAVTHWGAADDETAPSGGSQLEVDTANGDIVGPAAVTAAGSEVSEHSAEPVQEAPYERPASVFPAAARNYSAAPSEPEYADDDSDNEESAGAGKMTRILVGALLVVVLVVGVVFAFNTLGKNNTAPVAGDSAQGTNSEAGANSSGASESDSNAPTAAPEIADLTRLVPGNQALNAETDSTLAKAIDGSQGSMYRSYSYTTPEFGGFASNMVLVAKLKDEATVSEVQLTGLNATGGSFQVNVGDSEDLGSAQEVASGSFTGPTVTVPVSGDGSKGVKGKYVFINVTELPRLASTSNSSRPYGLQISEIKVS
ncbi:hypothetical protein GCM10009596_32090 [Arthrobacter rhombi]|uniref:ABC transporter substrate-binding protein n=1 Tax=Arthrobacter rhombi TaxID=71253 RepID=UPI0031DFA7C1